MKPARRCRSDRRRSEESGYALLMVFVLAAVVAITLYMEMPRVAFESQRTKEQLLIDRGEQYKRAIQIFYRKNKRFPTTVDELEKFQDVRSLRQRYKDPMTGKDEWRLIHVGPGGQLTDSLVTKQQNPLGQNGSNGTQGSNVQPGSDGSSNPGFSSSFGSQSNAQNGNGQPQTQYNANGIAISGADADASSGPPSGINMAVARRPSDQMVLAGSGQPGAVNSNSTGGADPNQPPDPSPTPDPNQGQNPAQSNQGGQVPSGQPQPNTGQPGLQLPGQQPYNSNQGNNGLQQQSSFGNNGSSFGNNGGSFGNNGSSFGNNGGNSFGNGNSFNTGGANNGANSFNSAGQGNPALNAVQNSLFSARQPNSGFNSGNAPSGGAVGIAGVATKYKGPSIKVVNERKKYQEWEFVYDMKKDKSLLGAAGVNQLQNAQNPGQGQNSPGFTSFGGNQNSSGSSFGNNNGSSSFGSGSSTQSQPQQPQQQQQQQ